MPDGDLLDGQDQQSPSALASVTIPTAPELAAATQA
jgi:hypothetical protein